MYVLESEFKTSDTISNLAAAQIAIQSEIQDISKDAKGYGYNYTSFDKLVQYLRPLLTKHGISFIQMPIGNDNEVGLTTLYMHAESGEWVSNSIACPIVESRGMNQYQSIGCAITYFRRYSLSSFVGIASEDDTDAVTDTVTNTKDTDSQVDKHIQSIRSESW